MDEIDVTILEFLKLKGRATSAEISQKIHLSLPSVAERIKKLEESGIIEKYVTKINKRVLGYNILAFIFVQLRNSDYIDKFRQTIVTFDFVLECYHMAGNYDYLLKVVVSDLQNLDELLGSRIKKIPGITHTNTYICLFTIKEEINP